MGSCTFGRPLLLRRHPACYLAGHGYHCRSGSPVGNLPNLSGGVVPRPRRGRTMLESRSPDFGPLPPRYKYQGMRRASRLTSPDGGGDPPSFVDTLLAYDDRTAVRPSTRHLREESTPSPPHGICVEVTGPTLQRLASSDVSDIPPPVTCGGICVEVTGRCGDEPAATLATYHHP